MKSSLPLKQGLLDRPRVANLLDHAIKSPLVTVIAGPGYGKTVEVASFVSKSDARLVWLHINRLDIDLEHFWGSFIHAVGEEFADLARQFEALGYPGTAMKFDAFIHMIAEEIYSGEHVVFVVDDYEHIAGGEINGFFEDIVRANLENFCLILISSAKIDIGVTGLRNGGLFQVTGDDLRFTQEEIGSLFAQYGNWLQPEKLREIDRHTDGWPMALYLLSQQYDPGRTYDAPDARFDLISSMFEREFFSGYGAEVQKLLVKLSLIHSFSFDIAKAIGGCDIEEATRVIRANLFIAYDNSSRLYTFQNMYRSFLADRQYLLDPDEKLELWRASGEMFLGLGYHLEAIDCFERCGRHDGIFSAIYEYFLKHVAYGRNRANYLLEKLDCLPAGFVEQNPFAEYMRAAILVNNLELGRAHEILLSLEARLSEASTPESRAVLGEVCWMIGCINIILMRTDFVRYFRRSYECLPGGSPIKPLHMYVWNENLFKIEGNQPGAIGRMEESFHAIMPYFVKVAHGGGSGMEHLFSAEARYMTLDLNAAKRSALKAVYAAEEYDQHDIVCNAHVLMANVAVMQGDYDEFAGRIELVRDYINDREIGELYDLRDCAMGRLYLTVGDLDMIADWIARQSVTNPESPPVTGGGHQMILAGYLLGKGKYHELMALLDHIEGLLELQGRWPHRLKAFILRAAASMRLGETGAALSALWMAYDMSCSNGILAPFIEEAFHMRSLVDAARRSGGSRFDPDWLDDVQRKSATCMKRISIITREYQNRNRSGPARDARLSRREMEILKNLSQGLTREEMAGAGGISINTVKSVIASIYNKLGAVNRADAVRIATAIGILK
ncbi:MAG: LuxR C-terminal-related transcriptional regulator [Synergistaceae bacterium]|jgi:LuxR family maltose regulon positive regulatory protein|nr:LuxR C-terminal-related transcriptional regulator [Synergistaceae bacterium]